MYILEDLYRVRVLLLLGTGFLPIGIGIIGGIIALQYLTDITAGLHQGIQLNTGFKAHIREQVIQVFS